MFNLESAIQPHQRNINREVRNAYVRTTEESWQIGELAHKLNIQWERSRRKGTVNVFFSELHAALEGTELSPVLKKEGGYSHEANKRIPSFLEAATETLKRLELLQVLQTDIPSSVEAIVLGGSMSYGPFYNIRGGIDASDIDLFYIASPEFFSANDAGLVLSSKFGLNEEDSARFLYRLHLFSDLYREQRADMMSQKFTTNGIVTSIKFFPPEVFQREFIGAITSSIEQPKDAVITIRDYKPNSYSMPHFTLYNFAHRPAEFDISEEILPDGSTITAIPSMILKEGHIYTGDHHNHVIPNTTIIFSRHGMIKQELGTFYKLLVKRLHEEQKDSDNPSDLAVINVQDRYSVLSARMVSNAQKKFI